VHVRPFALPGSLRSGSLSAFTLTTNVRAGILQAVLKIIIPREFLFLTGLPRLQGLRVPHPRVLCERGEARKSIQGCQPER
jgi:hypothetical protein